MTSSESDAALLESLEDRRLSRRERRSLRDIASTLEPNARRRLRERAFQITREAFLSDGDGDGAILNWLEEVVAILDDEKDSPAPHLAEAHFSPGDDCPKTIHRLLSRARDSIDICVFTITDDQLADAVVDAHRRKVPLRIITDNAKAEDLGSDIERFERAGIAVRVDRSPFHMHHKFAIIDRRTLLTGSYNWTRGAARDNEENLIVTGDPRFLDPFQDIFNRLWKELGDPR